MSDCDPRQLWLVQLRLECKALDATGRTIRIDGEDPDEIATYTVARFRDGFEVTFSVDANPDLVERAGEVDPAAYFDDPFAVAHEIGGSGEVEVGRCSTYAFTRPLPDVAGSGVRTGAEQYAILAGGQPVSGASSARSNDEAAELWVWTDPAHRRRGHARAVASAWAAEVNGGGKVAFYSHLAGNEPSRRLAADLGVRHLFDVVTLTVWS